MCPKISMLFIICIGRSMGGTKDAPPWDPNYFIFMQYFGKIFAK